MVLCVNLRRLVVHIDAYMPPARSRQMLSQARQAFTVERQNTHATSAVPVALTNSMHSMHASCLLQMFVHVGEHIHRACRSVL
jgi:hypothetical protein